jgi:molybdopterin/thiamine biosynthesis adenylyltransferase
MSEVEELKEMRIVVIGVGGTGGWLAMGLARMVEYRAPGSVFVIVDGDPFEPKNKQRQEFGKFGNKAEVRANELTPEFPSIFFVPKAAWVVAEATGSAGDAADAAEGESVTQLVARDLLAEGDVVFVTVDNFAARKAVFDAAREFDNIDVFTGGNDDEFLCTTYHYRRRNGEDVTLAPAVFHPEYDDPPDRNPGELSCQERAEIEGGTQLLATNMAVAALLLGRMQHTVIDGGDPGPASEIYADLGKGLAQSFDRSVAANAEPATVDA